MKAFHKAVRNFAREFVSAGGQITRTTLGRQVGAAGLFIILAAAIPAFGQAPRSGGDNKQTGSIHGTISTKQENVGSDLSGIGVKLTTTPPDGDGVTTVTDEAGRFEFKNLKPGSYSISIAQTGFKAVTKRVNVAAGQAAVQDFTLELE